MNESPAARSCESNPLWAAHFADAALSRHAAVLENVAIARDTYRIRLKCPEIAQRITPGQFVMLRFPGRVDPLLARPFALYDVVLDAAGEPTAIDVVFLVVGAMTGILAESGAGDAIEIYGPLGNGFAPTRVRRLIMVAGGIGQTPFLAVAKEYLGRQIYGVGAARSNVIRSRRFDGQVTLCYGARSSEFLAGVNDFDAAGVRTRISTDNGSAGHHGLVTEILTQELDALDTPRDRGVAGDVHIVTCGPEPMMEAVARIAGERGVSCDVSLETPMACGIGICFSCVAKVTQPDGAWDYKRTCVDGPVFDAAKIVW